MTILRSVDLVDGEYVVSDSIEVVGEVMGASSNLSLVYTQYYWYERTNDYNYYGEDHSVINTYLLNDGSAVLLQSVEIESGLSIASISDDHIILSSGYYYYPYYGGYEMDGVLGTDEVVYDDASTAESGSSDGSETTSSERDEAPPEDDVAEEEESYEEWTPETELHILKLESGVPKNLETLTVDGYFQLKLSGNGIFILQSGYTVVVYDLNGSEGIREIGSFIVPGYISGGETYEDGALMAMGLWGMTQIEY
jgi:hypothetical protein